MLALDKAPAQSEWRGGSPSGQLLTSARTLAGESRRVRLYLPDVDVSQPLGLVVLPDGETWFDHLGVCAAIDAAINNGRIVPVAVLGIDNIDEHERTAILGGRSELIKDIAGQLLPTIPRRTPAAAVGRPFAHRAGRTEPRRGQRAHGRSLRTGNVRGWRSATPLRCGGRQRVPAGQTCSAKPIRHG